VDGRAERRQKAEAEMSDARCQMLDVRSPDEGIRTTGQGAHHPLGSGSWTPRREGLGRRQKAEMAGSRQQIEYRKQGEGRRAKAEVRSWNAEGRTREKIRRQCKVQIAECKVQNAGRRTRAGGEEWASAGRRSGRRAFRSSAGGILRPSRKSRPAQSR